MTDAQVQIKLNILEKNIAGLQNTVNILQNDISSRTRLSDLSSYNLELRSLITDNSNAIVDIERRLAKILLPEETQYYLEEGEVEAFKSNFSKLKAMISRFEKLYSSLVAYTSNVTR